MTSPAIPAVINFVTQTANQTNGVTQKQIVNALGLSQSTISRILNGTPGFKRAHRPITEMGFWYDSEEVLSLAKHAVIDQMTKNTYTRPVGIESVTKITPAKPRRGQETADRLKELSVERFNKALVDEIAPALTKFVNGEIKDIAKFVESFDAIAIVLDERYPS